MWASQTPIRRTSGTAYQGENAVVEITSIKLFPNPLTKSGKVIVRAGGSGIAAVKVEVFNLAGAKVFEQEAFGNTLEFHAIDDRGQPLANGVYLYVIVIKGFDGRIERSSIKRLAILR